MSKGGRYNRTLNSIDWNEQIVISENDKVIIKEIGAYIDEKIEKYGESVKRFDNHGENEMGDTYYVDTSDDNIMAISVNEDGELKWNRVTALTKHLPVNLDGTDDLVKITTNSGKTVTATKAKSFLTRIDNKVVPIRGDEIYIGMDVPVTNSKYTEVNHNMIELVTYDKITSIDIVKPSHKFVYDLTVENLKTFVTGSGIFCFDTFHSAGIKSSVSLGVPRVKELLSLSKNIKTPTMNIYLTKENRTNQEIANKIASHLKHTTIQDVRKKIDIYYDPEPLDKDSFMTKDNVFNVFYSHNPNKNTCQTDIQSLPWLLRIELNRELLMEKDVTLLDIKSKYCNNWEKRYLDIKGLKKEERVLLERITQTAILSNSESDSNPIIHIRFDMTEFDFAVLVSFIDVFVDSFKLKGLENVTKINGVYEEPVITFDNEDEELMKEKQYVVYTAGVNLQDIRYLNGIDLNKTVCNDIMLIYETYGIDAVRMALIKEFKSVFAGAGTKVNFAHLETLCDLITNTGVPTSIDRHGMNKSETDPFARASFENTVDHLLQAAVFGEIDHMNNVSSRIMAGLAIKGGTGLCEVILDSDLLEKSEYTEDIEQKYVKTYNEVSKSNIITDVMTKEVSGFFVPDF